MASLFDIAPPELARETVTIRGAEIEIRGVTAGEWVALFRRFPALGQNFAGQPAAQSMLDLHLEQAAVIAAGLDRPGERDIEIEILKRLSRDEQREIVRRIMELSLPGDIIAPLLETGAAEAPGAIETHPNSPEASATA